MAKNKKVVRYRKPFHFNIGLIIFGIIFFYLMFYIYSYFTTSHISVYEVIHGSIAIDNSYTGLALRQEEIVASGYSGQINYYIKDASKTSVGELVYSVDSDGSIAEQINLASQDTSSLDEECLSQLNNRISAYTGSYRPQDFYEVYSFKDDLNAELSEAVTIEALSSMKDAIATAEENATCHTGKAAKAGIVVYYTDGYESVKPEDVTLSMFDESSYSKVNLKEKTSVTAQDPAYKLIVKEDWQLMIPVREDLAKQLKNASVVRIRFKKDGSTARVPFTIEEKDGTKYFILSLSHSMIRFAADRFVDIEFLLEEDAGLKIPNSAITNKEFFVVPMEYFQKGGDSNEDGIVVRRTDKNGNHTDEFICPVVYFSTEYSYYIDGDKLMDGDILLKPNSDETYTIHDTAKLEGIYCINKGYAVFRRIDTIYQNEEYSIIRSGTDYGISLYDHIALDGSAITENALLHE